MSGEKTVSVFDGVDEIVDEWLGLLGHGDRFGTKFPKYASKKAAIALAERQRPLSDELPENWGHQLVLKCLDQMGRNLDKLDHSRISNSNWRWEKSLNLANHNSSEEKKLEKIVAFLLNDSWVNQMPVCDGLHGKAGANACRVDLVHRTSDSTYDLIELKYSGKKGGGSDHPLYAAIEILKYGLVYLLFRQRSLIRPSTSPGHQVLRGDRVRLLVLAPSTWYYYRKRSGVQLPFRFHWLERALTGGLENATRTSVPDLMMSLSFEEMTPELGSLYMILKNAVDAFREANLKSRPVTFTESEV